MLLQARYPDSNVTSCLDNSGSICRAGRISKDIIYYDAPHKWRARAFELAALRITLAHGRWEEVTKARGVNMTEIEKPEVSMTGLVWLYRDVRPEMTQPAFQGVKCMSDTRYQNVKKCVC